jgi:cell division protein FtsL
VCVLKNYKHFLLGFGFLACLVPLYWAKAQADKMRDEMHRLQAEVAKEQKNIHTLQAEISYLDRYDRLENAAKNELGLMPVDGAQIVQMSQLDMIAPLPAPPTSAPITTQNPQTAAQSTPQTALQNKITNEVQSAR